MPNRLNATQARGQSLSNQATWSAPLLVFNTTENTESTNDVLVVPVLYGNVHLWLMRLITNWRHVGIREKTYVTEKTEKNVRAYSFNHFYISCYNFSIFPVLWPWTVLRFRNGTAISQGFLDEDVTQLRASSQGCQAHQHFIFRPFSASIFLG